MEIVISVAAKVAEYLVAPIIHPFTYCCTYKTNFEKLKNEADKLTNARDSVQNKVDDSRVKGDEILQHVEEWMISVDRLINEVGELIEDKEKSNNRCLKGLCPNLKTRYQLSKKAERQANAIVGLHEKGRFDSVSYRTIPEETWLKSTQGFMHFESRKSTLKAILDALSNRNFKMTGVYGMGGVGKTTLVKEVGRQAKENNLFDKVISSHVSRTPQIKEIQREIAEKIGLKLDEESETARAGRLLERLKKEKKILIILDDIWGSLDLEEVGIPLGDDNSGCKVLLTARSQDALSCKMDCQQNFSVDVLNEEEAWSLFTKTTGDCIENGEMRSVATDIVKECAGLPIAIVPVARALRNKRLFEWKGALLEFKRPSWRNFIGATQVAHKCIELSYNQLEGAELKRTFLLIGYTFISCVEDVLYYGVGLGLFQNVNTLDEARDRAQTLVDKLKNSCLLLDDNSSESFSMHDVVLDVAISIASRDQHVFVMENEVVPHINWPDKDTLKVCTAISLDNCNISELPQGFECPQLDYFCIGNDASLRIPDNLFNGMTELKVLDFTGMNLLPLPSSLGLLQNLQTLSLDDCELGDIAIIGDLKKLVILTLRGSDMEKLVGEIGQLAQLKLLDLSGCSQLQIIPPNVISSLSRLEELYIGDSLIEWGKVLEGVDGERRNASLDELNHLSKLTSLEIIIQDEETLPRDLSLFKMLQRYRIWIGHPWSDGPSHGISREFHLKITDGANICLSEGHIMQLKGIEDLSLDGLLDVKNVLYELGREGVPQLKRLKIRDNSNLFCVVDSVDCATARTAFPLLESFFLEVLSNLEKICRGPLTAESFRKLKDIRVERCDKLKNVFPLVIGRGLQQLQSIQVKYCQNMEVIFAAERGDDESSNNNNTQAIELTQLRKLVLHSLPQLTSFCTGDLHFEFPSLKELTISGCPQVKFTHEFIAKVFPSLEELRVDEKHIGLFSEHLLCKLKHLDVSLDESTAILSLDDFLHRCHTIKILLLLGEEDNDDDFYVYVWEVTNEQVENGMKAIIRGINQRRDVKQILKQESSNINNLEKLTICGCENLITLVPSSTSFQNLTALTVFKCNGMINLVPSSTSFQNLTTLKVSHCNGMINVLTSSTAKSLVRLREISIRGCNMITEILADDESSNNNAQVIELTQLRTLELRSLPQLTSFCTGDLHFEFPSLKQLTIQECPAVKFKSSTIHGFSKKVLHNLEELIVDEKHIGLFPEDMLGKLKHLDVLLDESATILSLADFLHILCTIKFLFITGVGDNHLGPSNKVENGVKTFIRINKRPDVKQIFKQESSIANYLEKLQIWSCDNLINLAPSSTSFQNLTTLWVFECNGMINVLTSSTAKSLVRLRQMFIRGCKMITEVVTDDDGVGDNYAAKDEVVFSELKELELWNLESLTSFYSGNHCVFKFPSLKQLEVKDCPNVNIFSGGELSTPNLHRVQHGEECWTWDRDLNSTIKCLYLKKKEENKNKNETSANANEKQEDAKKSGKRAQTFEDDSGQPSVQHLE